MTRRIRSCHDCRQLVELATTVRGATMPLDLGAYGTLDPAATVAAFYDGAGVLRCRTLTGDDQPHPHEDRRMPHAATCPPKVKARAARRGEVEGVIPFPRRPRQRPAPHSV